jgi:hypothetical protein
MPEVEGRPPAGYRALLLPVLAAVALHAGLVALYLARHDWDPGLLVCVGTDCAARPPYEAVRTGLGMGYDGQFYYALARAPWRRHVGDIDAPARHLRIVYPALCWLVSGGDGRRLLWVMPGINLAAIGGMAGIAAWLAVRRGISAWWGFLLPLALDAGLPTLRDLSDPVSTLAVLGLLAAWLVRAPAWSLLLWAAAALFSREQNAAVALALVAAGLWSRRLRPVVAVGAALALWGGWVGLLRAGYGKWPFLPGRHNFAAPLSGLSHYATHLATPGGSRLGTLFNALALGYLVIQIGLAVYLAVQARDRALSLVLLGGVLLSLTAGDAIYSNYWSFGRVLVWLPLGLSVWGLEERRGWILLLLAPCAVGTWAAIRGII